MIQKNRRREDTPWNVWISSWPPQAAGRAGRSSSWCGRGRCWSTVSPPPPPRRSTTRLPLPSPLPLRRYTYVLLHKPAGVLTATEDRRQPTVLELLPPELRRIDLAPVGRLDKDTEGLLLLTNDGELTHRLLSPRYHVDKRYLARVDGDLSPADVSAFAAGMTLPDGLVCLPAGLELLPQPCTCIVTLREGKFHQVKRMLAACGAPVLYLKRLSMGPLTLPDDLPPGAYRLLTDEEISALYRVCAM